jgi:hypothetical protein
MSKTTSKMLSIFHLFTSLPLEIRYIIWELTFTPRVVSLIYDQIHYEDNPNVFFPVLKAPHEVRFSIADNNLPIINALSVCQESRNFAKKKGYQPWKLQNLSDEAKQVMWNPALDTVSCGASWRLFDNYTPTPTFFCQFPVETHLVQYLALPSS